MSVSSGSMKRQQTLYVPQNIYINNNAVWHAGNLAKSEFAPSSHVGAGGSAHAEVTATTDGFMIAADKSKLDGISTGSNKVTSSTTNGNIQIDGTQINVYTHPSGDGNLHVPATGTSSNGDVLMAGSTAGSLAWTQLQFTNILSTSTITDTQHGSRSGGSLHSAVTSSTNGFMISTDKSKLDGIASGATAVASSATNGNIKINGTETTVYTHPTTAGNIHLPSGGATGQYVKYSGTAGTGSWATIDMGDIGTGTLTDTQHGSRGGASLHAAVTSSANGFMISTDKSKLDGIASSAVKVTSSTTNGNIVITTSSGTATETTVYTHPTTAGNIHLPSGGATGQYVKYSGTSGTGSWATIDMGDIGTGTLSDTQHGNRSGGSLHAVVTSSANGFMISTDKSKLDGIASGATSVTSSSTNGNIKINGTDTNVYTHPSGDGNMHVPATSTTNNAKVLKAGSTAGSITWANVDWSELTGKPSTYTPPIATSSALGGVIVGTGINVGTDGTITHPTGDGNLHVPATGTTNNTKVLKAGSTAASFSWANVDWTELTSKPSQFPPSAHTHAIADVTNLSSTLSDKASVSSANIFTYNGVAIKVQPSTAVGASAVLMQINNSTGNTLVTMGTDSSGESTASVVINGNLKVTGTTTQSATQNIQGDMNVSGNLSVTGTSTLGGASSDQTTVTGDLRLQGNYLPIGRYVEVARLPIFGIADDFQFETDSTTYQDIISHFSTFDTTGGSIFDAPNTGSARYYRVLVSYSTSGTDTANLHIVQEGTTTEVVAFTLPSVNGTLDPNYGLGSKARAWKSNYFTTTYTGSTTFQAQKNVSGNLAIRYIEIIAYDYYS